MWVEAAKARNYLKKTPLLLFKKLELWSSNVEKAGRSDQREGVNYNLIGIYLFKVKI